MSKIYNPEKEAIKLAEKYETSKGNTVKLFEYKKKADKGKYNGFDLISTNPEGNQIKIEVKGATREHGIPDPYNTEFSEDLKEMIADFMYVFYFPRDIDWDKIPESEYSSKAIFYKIPKGAIKPEDLKKKWGWVISPNFKNKRMSNFKKDFSVKQ